MKKQDDIFDELKELKDNSQFSVPEGYFETFHDRMKQRIEQESSTQKPRIISMLKPWMGLAAGFLMIVAVYITFIPKISDVKTAKNNTEQTNIFDDVINDPVLTQFNEYDLVCYLTGCDQNNSTNENLNENEPDLTGLTAEDIDDLILF